MMAILSIQECGYLQGFGGRMNDLQQYWECGGGCFFKLFIFSNVFDPALDLQLCWVSRSSSTHLQQDRVLF